MELQPSSIQWGSIESAKALLNGLCSGYGGEGGVRRSWSLLAPPIYWNTKTDKPHKVILASAGIHGRPYILFPSNCPPNHNKAWICPMASPDINKLKSKKNRSIAFGVKESQKNNNEGWILSYILMGRGRQYGLSVLQTKGTSWVNCSVLHYKITWDVKYCVKSGVE